jgi:peptidoglycan/LPS O-acetylase OafA/YrhL
MSLPAPQERLANVDALRGLAALSVTWYHFTLGNPNFLPDGFLKSSGSWGWLGVEVFFVISGFVLPLSLQRGNYKTSNFLHFIGKRLVRLEPPYLVTIALILVLGWLSSHAPGFAGKPWSFSTPQFLSHFGYLTDIMGYVWLSPAFWTLALEFQFYLLVGVTYSVVMNKNSTARWCSILCWVVLSLISNERDLVFGYLALFSLGLITAWFHIGWIRLSHFISASIIPALALNFKFEFSIALAGLLTAWAIAWIRIKPIRALSWLGSISYSLYLLHIPIGGRIINIGTRFADQMWEQVLVLTTALTLSLLSAYLLYRLIESPSIKIANRIIYSNTKYTASSLIANR